MRGHQSKKLIEAARVWAAGTSAPADTGGTLEDDQAGFNIVFEPGPDGTDPRTARPIGEAEAQQESAEWQASFTDREDGQYQILPENWLTWLCFLELSDQYELVGTMGGLYYAGMPVERIDRVLAHSAMKKKHRPEAYRMLRDMAMVAKNEMNQKLRQAAASAAAAR